MPEFSLSTWFNGLGPVTQAFLAGTLCWITTAIGAAIVFFE